MSVYDLRRIWKVPYSYDIKTGNICLPLTLNQLYNFDYSVVKPEAVLKIENLGYRGNCEYSGTFESCNEFFKKEFGHLRGFE
jgi:hypothetical protein